MRVKNALFQKKRFCQIDYSLVSSGCHGNGHPKDKQSPLLPSDT